MDGPDYAASGAAAVDDILHFGVKGMKWGVRKKRGSSSSSSSEGGKGGKPVSEDASKAHGHKTVAKKHGTDALGNKELQELVTRMNLEQQYGRLSSQNKGRGAKGARFVAEMLANVGKQQVTKLASDAIGQQLAVAINKKKGGK